MWQPSWLPHLYYIVLYIQCQVNLQTWLYIYLLTFVVITRIIKVSNNGGGFENHEG